MEWGVVTVIIALVGLGATVIKPIISLTESITKLTVETTALCKAMEDQERSIHESFVKVWAHEDEQDERLNEHEMRLNELEHK